MGLPRAIELAESNGWRVEIESEPKDAYLGEIEYFVKCVAEGRNPEVATVEDARAALALALDCIESAETGRPVTHTAT